MKEKEQGNGDSFPWGEGESWFSWYQKTYGTHPIHLGHLKGRGNHEEVARQASTGERKGSENDPKEEKRENDGGAK